MLSVDKYTNILDYKKKAVVTTPFLEKKSSTTEMFTTSDGFQKCTEKITTREEVFKGTNEVHKCTEKITKMRRLEKVLKNWKI